MAESVQHGYVAPRNVKPLKLTEKDITNQACRALNTIGIQIPAGIVRGMVGDMHKGIGMDSADLNYSPLPGTMSVGSIPTPIQFLQAWLPGFVHTITRARKIDQLMGFKVAGDWADEEVLQGVLEPLGKAVLYSDYGNIPYASWQGGYERRTIVRFEQGFKVGELEEIRTARAMIDSAAAKRVAATESLEIERNRIGFYGFNDGENRTYGFLNDPAILPVVTAPAGASGDTSWTKKTFLEITADIRFILSQLRVRSGDNIDVRETNITIALPTSTYDYLTVTSDFGNSVLDWVNTNYPNLRFISLPELEGAVGGENLLVAYVDSIDDTSTDDGATWTQIVPTKFRSLGTDRKIKVYIEDFTNATAGALLKRPFAEVRMVGI